MDVAVVGMEGRWKDKACEVGTVTWGVDGAVGRSVPGIQNCMDYGGRSATLPWTLWSMMSCSPAIPHYTISTSQAMTEQN